ncbi:MAG: hypothetical protein ACYDEN_05190 [Acidimicrobiales bacterium]
MTDPFAPAEAVADAVLYEGYVLYPYRASAVKNRARWQWGVLVPAGFPDDNERSAIRAECRLTGGSRLVVRARFLHLQHRHSELKDPADWDEGVAEVVDLVVEDLDAARGACRQRDFTLPAHAELSAGVLRTRHPVQGRLEARVEPGGGVSVTLANVTECPAGATRREEVLPASLVGAHLILAVEGGAFQSALDTGECRSEGCWPVLVGDADAVVLAAPIILYDHPQIAPESPGDLCDATEIDEILALRVLTLTDEEKAEARATDARAAAIVDRCDDMPPEVWERLHGALRSVAPAGKPAWWDPDADAAVDPWADAVVVAGVELRAGAPVRLRPSRRADAHDLFLAGMEATVAGVFHDVDGGEHVAVSLDADPATAELAWQGRYLYFEPDELEPLA